MFIPVSNHFCVLYAKLIPEFPHPPITPWHHGIQHTPAAFIDTSMQQQLIDYPERDTTDLRQPEICRHQIKIKAFAVPGSVNIGINLEVLIGRSPAKSCVGMNIYETFPWFYIFHDFPHALQYAPVK